MIEFLFVKKVKARKMCVHTYIHNMYVSTKNKKQKNQKSVRVLQNINRTEKNI